MADKKYLQRIAVGLHYALVVMYEVGEEQSKGKIIQRESEGCRGCQPMHEENMIQDQRTKAALTKAVGGKGKEWLYSHRLV